MVTCPKCHHDVAPGASFCASCGTAIVAAQPQGEPRDPFIGQTFKGTYFVEMRIGGGGMGDVYRARHVTLDVPFALKILKKALLHDPAIVQRFHREARAASQLRHPNIVNVTDFGQTEDGTLYMVMEHVAGKSLARAIAEESPLSEQRIVHVGQQILSALAEAHASKVLHRDLKPENVMLESRRNEPDVAKVLDFGIAKIQGPGERGVTLTQAGLVCGTPGYMSPEQWSGEELDARSDLYSVGVILYEMLTGKLPFEAQTPMELVRKHLTEPVVPPSARRDGGLVSPDLEGLVMRTLSSAREDRPASAEEMRGDLLACVLSPEPRSQDAEAPKTVVLPRCTPAGSAAPKRVTPPATAPFPAARVGSAAGARRGLTPAPRRTPTPPRGKATPPPRHEMDEVEEEETSPPPAPRRPSRVPLIAGAVAAAIAVLGGGAYLATRGRDERGALAKRAQEDAAWRAEAEARQRAEEDARRRAEEEAKRRSEEEGRQAAEDASRRAEMEARKRDAEATRRAEEPKKRRTPRRDRFDSRSKLYSFPLPQATDGKGVLSISAEPPGGSVLVDEVAYGVAPCEILVPGGSYHVRVRFKGGEQSKQLRVRAGTREIWMAVFTVE
jgi:serine/threonine-protein kinase